TYFYLLCIVFCPDISELFEHPKEIKDDSEEQLKDELFKQIGQLRVENEWLKKKSAQFIK
ncbi:MAG: hypothetical protein WCG45_04695, partial [bacterium]